MNTDTPPSRATLNDIPAKQHFEIRGAFELEQKRITDWLRASANMHLRSPGNSAKTSNEAGRNLIASLDTNFGTALNRNAQLMGHYDKLGQHAPGRFAWLMWGILAILAMAAELGIGFFLWMVQGASIIALLIAFLLVVGGALLGIGIEGILMRTEFQRLSSAWAVDAPAPSIVKIVLCSGIGAGLIVVLSVVRTLGERHGVAAVVAITVGVAVAVAVLEAVAIHARQKYNWLRTLMFECQIVTATELHRKNINNGVYFNSFTTFVRELDASGKHPIAAAEASRASDGSELVQ